MSTERQIAKATGLVLLIGLLTKPVTFLREMVIAHYFGTGGLMDAYLVAYTAPNFLFLVTGAVIGSAFLPVFTEYKEQKPSRLGKLTSTLLIATSGVTLVVALAMILEAGPLIRVIAPGLDIERMRTAAGLLRVMAPAALFLALAPLASSMLRSFKSFVIPTLAPFVFQLCMIATIVLLVGWANVYSLAWGFLIGSIAQVVVQAPLALKRVRLSLTFDLGEEGVRQFWRMAAPIFIGESLIQLYPFINRYLASGLEEGSIAALYYGDILNLMLHNMIIGAVLTVTFPYLSEQQVHNQVREMRQTVIWVVRTLALIFLPIQVELFALSVPVMRLLFERGAFDATSTALSAAALRYYSLRLTPMAVLQLVLIAFYALKDTRTPVAVGILAIVANAALGVVLMKPMGYLGLALATTVVAVVRTVILLQWVLRRLGTSIVELGKPLFKMGLAAVTGGVFSYFVAEALASPFLVKTLLGQAVQVGTSLLIGGGIYLSGLWMLRTEESAVIQNAVRMNVRTIHAWLLAFWQRAGS